MNEITKAGKLFTVILSDWQEIVVTEAVADMIKDDIKMWDKFIEINNNTYSTYEIKRIIEKKQKTSCGYNWICDYWTRHALRGKELPEPCNCFELFKIEWFKFYDWLTDRWYRFEYASDIKPSWQSEFLKQKQNKSIS